MEGKLDSISVDKGFGFIIGEDNKRYFFHKSDFHGFWVDLVTDWKAKKIIKVQFDGLQTPKGPRASVVSRLDFLNQSVTEI